MPLEFTQLLNAPVPLAFCPVCKDKPFDPFMRGMVQRPKRAWWIGPRQPYCALICSKCKEIVAWENP
jgi:hypothetical protein